MAVDFSLSSDQRAVSDAFEVFFANESSPEVVRAAEPLGFSGELWAKLVAMDAPGMAAAESAGGSGAALSELTVVAEALGSALAPVPLIEHWVASQIVAQSDAAVRKARSIDGVIDGSSIATLALHPADGEGRWRLVPAGAVADLVVGVDGDDMVAVRSTPPGEAPPNHGSAPLADRSARDGERVVLGDASLLAPALDRWRTLTAAALVGLATRALQIGVDYVLEREQFGRPIGSYQAIQHTLADLPAMIDGARFLTHKAAWAHDSGLVDGVGVVDLGEGVVTEFAPTAAMAFLQAGDAAAVCTDRSLHYHGGYGFSVEYDIQLYYRRARAWANVLGDPARERLRLADLLLGSTVLGSPALGSQA